MGRFIKYGIWFILFFIFAETMIYLNLRPINKSNEINNNVNEVQQEEIISNEVEK